MGSQTEYLAPPLEADPQALFEQFSEILEAYFPGWSPTSGNLDVRIGGAEAIIASQLYEAAAEGATDVYRFFGANIAGIPPHEATFATARCTFLLTDELGHEIPQSTIIVWTNGLGQRVSFETVEPVKVESGQKEAVGVVLRAVLPGTEGNNLNGLASELVRPLAWVSSIVMIGESSDGEEAEEDGEYLTRLKGEIELFSAKPIVPKDFNKVLTLGKLVGRATTVGGFSPTNTVAHAGKLKKTQHEVTELPTGVTELLTIGTKVTGTHIKANTVVLEVKAEAVLISTEPEAEENVTVTFTGLILQPGWVTSWVGSSTGTALTTEQEASEEARVQAMCLAGVNFRVLRPTFNKLKVKIVVYAWPEVSNAQVKEGVEAQIRRYLSGENWGAPPTGQTKEWNNDPHVRLVNVEHVALQTVGAHYISEIKLNGNVSDVLMIGYVPLPEIETLEVEVKTG